jgi:hypothetical protein
MCAKMLNLQIILLLNLFQQNVDTLRAIHHLLTAQETLFILIGDMQSIITIFDMLLKSLVNLHYSPLIGFLLIDNKLIIVEQH